MKYLQLFLIFLKIGAVSFGGGYSMLPMVHDEVVSRGWLTEGELMNFIGVAESTPGRREYWALCAPRSAWFFRPSSSF